MANTFIPAPELAGIAADLISSHHPHLKKARLVFVWRTEPVKRGDLVDFGKASKVGGLNAFLAREQDEEFELVAVAPPRGFFVIQLWQTGWAQLKEDQRLRVLDHLLCYLVAEDIAEKGGEVRVSLRLRSPEVVEFKEIYARHKATAEDLAAIAVKVYQDETAARKPSAGSRGRASESNGKPSGKGSRKKKDIPLKAGVSKETVKCSDGSTMTLAVTPDGTEFQFMIARREPLGKDDQICVAGQRADSVEAARIYFEQYCQEFVGATS